MDHPLAFGTIVRLKSDSRHDTEKFPVALIVGDGLTTSGGGYRYPIIGISKDGSKLVFAKGFDDEFEEVVKTLTTDETLRVMVMGDLRELRKDAAEVISRLAGLADDTN